MIDLNKQDLLNLLDERFATSASDTLDQDLQGWHIDTEAFMEISTDVVFRTSRLIMLRAAEPLTNLHALFYIGFSLGYKAALEVEMRRISASDG